MEYLHVENLIMTISFTINILVMLIAVRGKINFIM